MAAPVVYPRGPSASDNFAQSYANVQGLMSLAERNRLAREADAYNAHLREIQRPIAEATAVAQINDVAAKINTQRLDAERQAKASEDLLVAQDQFQKLDNDPTPDKQQAMIDWLSKFGSYADLQSPYQDQFKVMADRIKYHTLTIDQMREIENKRRVEATARRNEEEDDRLTSIKRLKDEGIALYGEEFQFNKPFALEGTDQAVIYTPEGKRYVSQGRAPRSLRFYSGLYKQNPSEVTDSDRLLIESGIRSFLAAALQKKRLGQSYNTELAQAQQRIAEYQIITGIPYLVDDKFAELAGQQAVQGASQPTMDSKTYRDRIWGGIVNAPPSTPPTTNE